MSTNVSFQAAMTATGRMSPFIPPWPRVSDLRWRWRSLGFLPASRPGVWWSGALGQPISSLGSLWTENNTLVSSETDGNANPARDVTLDWSPTRLSPATSHAVVSSGGFIWKRAWTFVVLTCLVSGSRRSKNALTVARTSSLHLEHKDVHTTY